MEIEMTDEEFEAALCGMSVQTIEVVRVSLPDWEPKAACCHENVDAWVKANPGSKSIRGWLIQGGCDPLFLVTAHSIVQRRDGSLIDITATDRFDGDERADPPRQFVRHPGDEQSFWEIEGRKAQRSALNVFDWGTSGTA
jgi:hypothetical protein